MNIKMHATKTSIPSKKNGLDYSEQLVAEMKILFFKQKK